ncbi:hypothetical protein [Bosea sp. (in: a-proteobacteria)]|jgi:hypothetical protein|uniref:hypothetical protein n=1 Tax=Bosea sp. (in: a-proteobacteria) TaxID=1871050 RepID=UPI001AD203E3|nr:hypothetical protein [Bosea sp. (in: a-proteobacteria)]MBN9440620.1 hypothetical protein [Bosea sp. (in: a-proteobacteria)]
MSSQVQHSYRLAPVGVPVRAAAFAILAGFAFLGLGSTAASAQSNSWERACAERMVSPGSGDALRAYNCARQKECQAMANAKGAMMMERGCFFVSPSTAEAGRSRPGQQQ